MDDDKKKPVGPDQSGWRGEVGEETQKVRKERGIVDPEVPEGEDDEDDPTLPPALPP